MPEDKNAQEKAVKRKPTLRGLSTMSSKPAKWRTSAAGRLTDPVQIKTQAALAQSTCDSHALDNSVFRALPIAHPPKNPMEPRA